ncbi:hypothetical protein MW344_004942 [Vibrio parahaemolyticus]|nr:hypothetical protein [Vibrio parahaemolyticus]
MDQRKIRIDNGFEIEEKIKEDLQRRVNQEDIRKEGYFKFKDKFVQDFSLIACLLSPIKKGIETEFKTWLKFTAIISTMLVMPIITLKCVLEYKLLSDVIVFEILESEFDGVDESYSTYHPIIESITKDKIVTNQEFDELLSIMETDSNMNLGTTLMISNIIKQSKTSRYIDSTIEQFKFDNFSNKQTD